MNSLYFPNFNDNMNTTLTKENSNNSLNEKDKIKDLNSFKPFKAFSSALFMSEFQENDETLISSDSNSTSNKEEKNKNILDLNISPSLEKCLTNELLQSMADDSSNFKLRKNSSNNSDNNKQENKLKITKKLFDQNNIDNLNNDKDELKEKNGSTCYEDSNNGFEYQLKFIENSVNNILPKSYKKFHKNNFYNNNYSFNKNNHRTSFPFSNKYKYNNNYNYYKNSNEQFYYTKDKSSLANIFYPNLINKNNDKYKPNNNYICDDRDIKNKILVQIQKVKDNENNYDDWICNNCEFLNRGYRKICAKCNFYRKK